jgi:alpha-beta hydrolase superfamily lysophospholipase
MVKPAIVFVPGLWEGAQIYSEIATTLSSHGYNTHFAPLVSTGKPSPGNPTMLDDVDAVRSVIEPLVYAGNEVLVVCHSAGGFIGSAAIEGLTLQKRKEEGKQGGVGKLAFLAAGLFPEGMRHPESLPCSIFQVRYVSL